MTEIIKENIEINQSKTRELLLNAALKLFARYGYSGASTRAIADYAGVNQALINYHFKGKRGLYLAVFEKIKNDILQNLGSRLNKVFELSIMDSIPHAICLDAVFALSDNAIEMLVSDDMDDKSQLILREQQNPTEAFDIIYYGFMEPALNCMHKLLLQINSDISPQDLRIFTITLFAQVTAFRTIKTTAKRYLEWSEFGPKEVRKIKSIIRDNFIKLIGAEL